MKSRFLVITVIISILAAGGILLKMKTNQSSTTLRVAFPSTLPATAYEPTNINLDYEYIFLENVFSPLIEIDPKGELKPGLAQKADWVGDELKLTLRDNISTASGVPITADDVVFSLKRLLILSGNTHGNFKDLVCPGVDLKSIEEPCPGIRSEGSSVFLKAPRHKSFLRPMLAAIDFAIIPRSSIDPKTLKITNFKETSGPYYVETDDGIGNIHLRLNKKHYHATENIAQNIILVPSNTKVKGDSLRLLSENKVDLLTTVDAAKADEILAFAEENSGYNSHVTMKIRSLLLVFTEKGQKRFSPEERFNIGEKIRWAFTEIYKDKLGFEQRDEFFPSQSEGGLTKDQRQSLVLVKSKGHNFSRPEIIRLQFIKRNSPEEWSKYINQVLPQADCYTDLRIPDLSKDLKEDTMPDAFIASTDTGFMEDISLISYSLYTGCLGLKKSERAMWLADYMALDDKNVRIKKLQELHLNALSSPVIVPITASPYASLVRKPWKIELSQLYANNQLWLIKTN